MNQLSNQNNTCTIPYYVKGNVKERNPIEQPLSFCFVLLTVKNLFLLNFLGTKKYRLIPVSQIYNNNIFCPILPLYWFERPTDSAPPPSQKKEKNILQGALFIRV